MRLLALILLLAGTGTGAAQAPDCPPGANRDLCAAERGLRGAAAALATVTPRHVTAAQRTASALAALPGEDEADRIARLTGEAEDMAEAARMDRAVRTAGRRSGCREGPRACVPHPPGIPRPADWETRCFSAALSGCRVAAAGILNGEGSTGRLLFQVQAGRTERDGLRAGIVLLSPAQNGTWAPLAWAFEGAAYEAPRLVEGDDGPLLLIPGRRGGSTGGNAELLYRRTPGGWRDVGLDGWQSDLAARLPAGLELRGPVDYDMRRLTARTRLWRDGDANCCATGGWATLRFRLDGDALRLEEVRLDEARVGFEASR
ncbi:hypothetical protein ACE7GA_10285 [Roseomonas sp. CCTCC AB2023176]|uniref:hypothetical protein n=1 Tax=Roseomonas sp. CCTCC AB2023176 TaxID=3342640 RepID=UPI0035DC75EC